MKQEPTNETRSQTHYELISAYLTGKITRPEFHEQLRKDPLSDREKQIFRAYLDPRVSPFLQTQ